MPAIHVRRASGQVLAHGPDGNRWEVDTVIEDIEATTREARPACGAR